MNVFDKKTTLGLIIGSREFFNGKLALDARRDVIAQLDKMNIGYRLLPVGETNNGCVQTSEDVRKYAQFFDENRQDIDGIVVLLPNFGDEIAVAETIHRSKLNVPILVQACNDEVDKFDLRGGRRDAFCGKLSVCNNLYQYGIAFSDTTSHTCDIAGEEFAGDLDRFARVCRTVKGLKNARIGAIGARTGAFRTVRYSEKILQASGLTVVTVDLSEILGAAQAINDEAPEVKAQLEKMAAYGRIPAHIKHENVVKQAKLSIAVNRWIEKNECDASAIQCWTSVQENFGCATCLSMSMLSERLMPSACEVDVAGAISMYALALASGTPAALADWNNNYGQEANKCICFHCGNFPKSFLGTEPEISNLEIIGVSVGPERCFGAVKGKAAPGPMTYFRLSTDDVAGQVRGYVGEGRFTDDQSAMDGCIAIAELPRMRDLFKHLCRHGFEHHVAMVRGNHAAVVEEAVARYMKWNIYHHA